MIVVVLAVVVAEERNHDARVVLNQCWMPSRHADSAACPMKGLRSDRLQGTSSDDMASRCRYSGLKEALGHLARD